MRVLAGLLAVVLAVSACQTSPGTGRTVTPAGDVERELSGPVSIRLWHAQTGSLGKSLQEMVDRFNATHGQGITVVMEYQGSYAQLYQKTLGAIGTGQLPELAVGYESFVADYQKAAVVLDLDPYLGSSKHGLPRDSLDDIFATYLEANRFRQLGNALLSFPLMRSVLVMYQNDDLLRSGGQLSPRTWDEFEKAARALTQRAADGRVTRSGWAVPTSASTFNGWILSRGGRLISDDGRSVAWDGREGLESLRLYQKLVREGVAYVPKGFDHQSDFAAGKVAFLQGSSTERPFIVAAFPAGKAAPGWSIVSIPQTDAARARTVQFGPNLIAFKSTPEKQLASWLFMRWFTDPEQTADWAQRSSYLPVRKSVVDSATLRAHWAKDTQGRSAFELTATALPEPNIRGQQDIRAVIEQLLTGIATGRLTDVETALADAAAKANAILRENR